MYVTRSRICLATLLIASTLLIQSARGSKEETKEPLVRQQRRPGTWSESSNDAGFQRSQRSEEARVRQADYGYNNPSYPYRPYNQRPYPYPYDDAEDLQYYRPPYRPTQQVPYVPPVPYVPAPPPGYYVPPPYFPYTTTTTTTANPLAPIGFMLVDTYTSPLGKRTITPRAFYKVW